MTYVPPTSFYDIFPNDFQHWSFVSPVANLAGGAPAGMPRYGFENPGGAGTTPVLMTPAVQVPSPVGSTDSSMAPSPLSSQSMPPISNSSAPSSGVLSFQDLAQLSQMHGVSLTAAADAPAPPTKRRTKKRNGPPRRRGPNKRMKGSGYFDMMRELPLAVQNAVQQEYPDCCEVVRGKDPSTVQKHRFAKRHFNKIEPKLQPLLPAFTCPAFVGLHDKCNSAKAGRYDSTERHCNNCPGFQELQAGSIVDTLYPFIVNKQEFDAISKYRKTLKLGKKLDDAPDVVVQSLERLRRFLLGLSKRDEENTTVSSESQLADDNAGASSSATKQEPSPSPSPPPMEPSLMIAQPQQHFEFFPEGQLYDFTGNGGALAVEQQVAPESLIDNFGALGAFPPVGPGLLFPPPYGLGLYPADPSTWPNVSFDPTAFRPLF
ncbi:hypothetical protein EI94DRAFT_1698425 [Lactarius quietus]|nr:hypothetical protein EI94DRAFT_1698425 [Lactarius quietus]